MGWWPIGHEMVNGDGPADILGAAVDDTIMLYLEDLGRKPYREELVAALQFDRRDQLYYETCIM